MTKTNMKDDPDSGWVNFRKQGFQPSSSSGRPTLPDGKVPVSGIYERQEDAIRAAREIAKKDSEKKK